MTLLPNLGATRPVPIVIVGHVGHGKSTLTGRLMHHTGAVPSARVEAIRAASERRGRDMEWAFLLDGFQAERDRGITIDTTRIRFSTAARRYTIIDAPGHKEFLKNMITGAASAHAAVLVIDVTEGLAEQTKRHATLLRLLGVRHVIVVVNKMDRIDYRESAFAAVAADIRAFLSTLGVQPEHILPLAAKAGENITAAPETMPWYTGPTLIGALDGLPVPTADAGRPLRLPIQDVYDFDGRSTVIGRVESGRLHEGARVTLQPSGRIATVSAMEGWSGQPEDGALAGRSVALALDPPLTVQRGEVLSALEASLAPTNRLRATVFWLAETPLSVGVTLELKAHTARYSVTVTAIDQVIDADSLATAESASIPPAAVGHVVLESAQPMALESFTENPQFGRFVLLAGYEPVGGGIVADSGPQYQTDTATPNLFPVRSNVSPLMRAARFGHQGAVVWLTGLSGAGKSTIAYAVEQRLIATGRHAYVLDGDNLRRELSTDLGFSAADRAEHIRRVGAAARLFADAGMIVLVAVISPSRADRAAVRHRDPARFREVFVRAPLSVCEERDPKRLYERARRGEIADFTGVSAPFEIPDSPELVLDTGHAGIEDCAEQLFAYIEDQVRLDVAA